MGRRGEECGRGEEQGSGIRSEGEGEEVRSEGW